MPGNSPFVDDIVLTARDESAAGYASYIKNTKDAKAATDQLGSAASGHVKSHADLGNAVDKTSLSLGEQRRIFRTLAAEASLMGGPLGQVIRDTGLLAVGSQRLSLGITGATLAISASAAAVYLSVGAYIELQKHQTTVNNLLAATKSNSGETAASLESMAHRLAASGTQSLSSIREAQVELLKFKSVAGASFEAALKVAKDLAASGFGDLKSATSALAQALKDPANANQHLEATTLQLSAAEQRLAFELANAGRFAEAKRVILNALSKQVTGADAAAADTLSAAWGRVATASQTVLEKWGSAMAEGATLTAMLNVLAKGLDEVAKDRQVSGLLKFLINPLGRVMDLVGPTKLGEELPISGKPTAPKAPMMTSEAAKSLFGVGGDSLRDAISDYTDLTKGLDKTTEALRRQAATAGMNSIQQLVYNEAIKIGALGNADATGKIRGWVTAIEGARVMRQITDQIKEQTATQRIEGETVGMTTIAAKEYQMVQEAVARERIKGINLSADQVARLQKEAAAWRQVSEATAAARLNEQLMFDRAQLGRSSTEQLVASQLKSAGINADSDAGRMLATQIRLNDALKDTKELASDALKGFVADLRAGKSAAEALSGALDKIATKLIDKAIDNLVSAALGGVAGGGLLKGLLGGTGTIGSASSAAIYHTGGMVGAPSASRYVHPAYFDNALRFHGGGIAGDEVPIIAKRGELVGWPDQMRAEFGGDTNLHVHISLDGANGDEAVRRIAYEATGRGVQELASRVPGMAVRAVSESSQRG